MREHLRQQVLVLEQEQPGQEIALAMLQELGLLVLVQQKLPCSLQ